MPTILELGAISDCRDHGCRGLRANAFDSSDALARLTGLEDLLDFLVERTDPLIEILEEIIKFCDNLTSH